MLGQAASAWRLGQRFCGFARTVWRSLSALRHQARLTDIWPKITEDWLKKAGVSSWERPHNDDAALRIAIRRRRVRVCA